MTDTALTDHHDVAIIGTGFGGLAAAIQLKRAGFDDLVILEKAGDVGGVWRDNSYPGCACDVQSHLYSYSFAPNPTWGHMFSRQPEIWAYLRRCATEFGLDRHIRFNTAVEQLLWMDEEQQWAITTSTGILTAAHVVLATGALSEPKIPDLPGLDEFDGAVFHSARWNHDFDLTGKRVAVVGTGASAIQFVPAIQPHVGKLTLFQRTPPWVMPRHDRPITDEERSRFDRFPITQRLARWRIYLDREWAVVGFRHPRLMRIAEQQARKHLARQVNDPDLRRKLTPDYRLGCKRILISNDYLRSLDQPNSDVVTGGIREIRAHSVIDNDGVEHEVDAIIFGTGFRTLNLPVTESTYGRDGRSMAELWNGSPHAYVGTTVPGFPNIYLMHGPNVGLGHTSVIHMFESQVKHVVGALSHARAHGIGALEPTSGAVEEFARQVDSMGEGTVWTAGGCTSWYLDRTGRNSSLWPGTTLDFRRRARFDPADYVLTPRVAERRLAPLSLAATVAS